MTVSRWKTGLYESGSQGRGIVPLRHSREKNKKGFTLAELLIVVAIIAVLVAIAIPVFNNMLEKSREAYDIYTMRQAASAAIELFYAGVRDEESATAADLWWWPNTDKNRQNAAGVYDPATGKFLRRKSGDPLNKAYGKGTKRNGGTEYKMENGRIAYKATEDYTNAFVMVAIYPDADVRHIDVYWKTKSGPYVGGDAGKDNPKYSIRIDLP